LIPPWHAKFAATENERMADKERRRLAEERQRVAQEQLRAAQAKRGEQARIGRIQSLNIPKSELVVWSGPSGTGEFKGTSGDARVFEQVNARFQGELERRQRVYSIPAKGELETTPEYQQRVAAYRAKYGAMTSGNAVLEEYIGRELSNPMIGAVDYDADSGKFTLHVAAEKANYRLKTEYAVPRDKAFAVKDKLLHGAPNVVFSFANYRLVLRDVFLVSDGETLPLRPAGDAQVSVQFTKESADVFRAKLAQEKAQQERARYEATRPKSTSERNQLAPPEQWRSCN
jgi:hypothetical protein